MSAEYDQYIVEHKKNLMLGLQWMEQNLPHHMIDGEKMVEAMANAEVHDQSKYDKEEYDAYDSYFYGNHTRPPEVQAAFDKAWLHHIHLNPHHWQHWVLLEDDPNLGSFGKVLDMPLEYIYEMIADWWTFSWKNNHLMGIFDWYAAHQNNIRLSLKTRMIVEQLLSGIYRVLRMQMVLAGKEDEVKTYIFVTEPLVDMALGDDMSNLSHGEELDEEELKKRKYAFPEERKFPMPDAAHVKSAIRFFNYVDPKDEEKLANAILERMKEYDMSFDDFGVGDENRFKKYIPKEHLEHSGTKGMKWGVRNYQNPDGTWTELGKERRRTVFVSGSSKTQDKNSGYFRKELPKPVRNELDRHMKNGDKFVVGDAPGVDRQVQDYLNAKKYDQVEIYGPGTEVRYSANKDWVTHPVDAPEYEKGSKEWLAAKDKAMADVADEGLAIILDEGSKATRKNIARLADDLKETAVYQLSGKDLKLDNWLDEYSYLTLLELERS